MKTVKSHVVHRHKTCGGCDFQYRRTDHINKATNNYWISKQNGTRSAKQCDHIPPKISVLQPKWKTWIYLLGLSPPRSWVWNKTVQTLPQCCSHSTTSSRPHGWGMTKGSIPAHSLSLFALPYHRCRWGTSQSPSPMWPIPQPSHPQDINFSRF